MDGDVEFTGRVMGKAAGISNEAAAMILSLLAGAAVPGYMAYKDVSAPHFPSQEEAPDLGREAAAMKEQLRKRRQYGRWL